MKNKIIKLFLVIQSFILSNALVASATNKLEDTVIVKGTSDLINDIISLLLKFVVIGGIVLILYFIFRYMGSDETDQKRWLSRIKITIISIIGATLTKTIVSVILSYYS